MNQQKVVTRHLRTMLALRQLMGLPAFHPVNDSILFCTGEAFDAKAGMELAGLAQKAQRDIVCIHFARPKQGAPSSYTVVLRELMGIDVISNCVAWTWGGERMVLVSPRLGKTFRIDWRGMMQRGEGVPDHLVRGGRLAELKIRELVASKRRSLGMACSSFDDTSWLEPGAPIDAVVRID